MGMVQITEDIHQELRLFKVKNRLGSNSEAIATLLEHYDDDKKTESD